MSRPRVTLVSVTGRAGLPAGPLARLEADCDLSVIARGEQPALTRGEATGLLAGADLVALTPKVTPVIDDDLLGALPRLRAVALHATGTDLYDLSTFQRHQVGLTVLPEYCTASVAEHALGLLLTLSRRIHLAHDKSRGLVPAGTSVRGFELSGRTLGMIGFGRIGSRIAMLGQAFGMRVLATDPRGVAAPGVEEVTMTELLRRSDAVVVACARQQADPPVLGPAELDLMPTGSVLVAISRAAAVDTRGVVDRIRSGRLRGYAVDDVVIDPSLDGDLLTEGRVVQTGHCAWWSDEVLRRGAEQWLASVQALVSGGPVTFAVRPPDWRPLVERHLDGSTEAPLVGARS